MAEGKIRVKFDAQGDKGLIEAIRRLNKETKKLGVETKKYKRNVKEAEKEQDKQRKTTRNLAGTFSTLRSKMLLSAFAVKQFADPFINLARKSIMVAANFEALETRLVSMTGSTRTASEMMKEFRDIAATTPFAVQDVVEAGVQLRAFGVDAQEMIKPVTDLAAFMGTTATEAASALGRAFAGGAGAADILRERGILQLIKDTQGITDLSKTTLPEFREALEKALIDPVAGIAGATDKLSETTIGAFSNMQDALDNFLAESAEISGLKDSITELAESTTELLNSTTSEKIERFSNLAKITVKLALGMATGGSTLAVGFKDLRKNIDDFFNTPITGATKEQEEALKNQQKQIAVYSNRVITNYKQQETAVKDVNKAIDDLFESDEALIPMYITREELLKATTERIKELDIEMLRNVASSTMLSEVFGELSAKDRELNSELLLTSVAINTIGESTKHNIPLIEQLGASLSTNATITKEGVDEMSRYIQSSISMGRSINHVGKAASTAAQHFIVSKVQEGVASYIADFLKTTPLPVFISAPLAVAGGAAFGSAMQQTIDSVAKFKTGGLVGGKRHSQGGTIIEAERGEFVMSRNAVSAIGVENLNKMNEGQGGTNNISININGGMISPDFVENELAESIREAVRRGADFGIS
tara:strand:- start:544 stop:2490 length:1947 start_codon:yes stop_codon:yes gene_type:complete